MKMWTALSVSRWIFLLSLCVVMFFSVSQGKTELMIECSLMCHVKPVQVSLCNAKQKKEICRETVKSCVCDQKREGLKLLHLRSLTGDQ